MEPLHQVVNFQSLTAIDCILLPPQLEHAEQVCKEPPQLCVPALHVKVRGQQNAIVCSTAHTRCPKHRVLICNKISRPEPLLRRGFYGRRAATIPSQTRSPYYTVYSVLPCQVNNLLRVGVILPMYTGSKRGRLTH